MLRSGSNEDSKALKMRVPQQCWEFFAGGGGSHQLGWKRDPVSPSMETTSPTTVSETV